jgi:hypothetical protein
MLSVDFSTPLVGAARQEKIKQMTSNHVSPLHTIRILMPAFTNLFLFTCSLLSKRLVMFRRSSTISQLLFVVCQGSEVTKPRKSPKNCRR